jgi:arylsulfatase A-like enzyme
MDLMPTLCRASGIDWMSKTSGKPKVDGRDLWEKLVAGEGDVAREELLYWHGLSSRAQAIRVGEWKLFFDRRHALEGSGTNRKSPEQAVKVKAMLENWQGAEDAPLLFNLNDDPGETIDLSEKFPAKVKELKAKAAKLIQDLDEGAKLELAKPVKADP